MQTGEITWFRSWNHLSWAGKTGAGIVLINQEGWSNEKRKGVLSGEPWVVARKERWLGFGSWSPSSLVPHPWSIPRLTHPLNLPCVHTFFQSVNIAIIWLIQPSGEKISWETYKVSGTGKEKPFLRFNLSHWSPTVLGKSYFSVSCHLWKLGA